MSAKFKAIVNGVVGDHLDETGNELATAMGLYSSVDGSTAVSVDFANIATPQVCIFVHGLTDNESVWASSNTMLCENYGDLLQRDLGQTPLYLRYNTGLHISTNGQRLSHLLETQTMSSRLANLEINFVCHSMGGLVTRSACLHAIKACSSWTNRVRRIIFLGTPHHGSFWEKMGNVVSIGMANVPFMRLASNVANLRSDGIKDLRYGYVQPEDWQGLDPDAFLTNSKQVSELLPLVNYYIASGTVTENPDHPVSRALGDALVRKDSAHGISGIAGHTLVIPSRNIREFPGVSHLRLPNHIQVYDQIKEWMADPCCVPVVAVGSLAQQKSPTEHEAKKPPTSWAQAKGATTLLETAIDKGTTAIEELQDQVTELVYDTLSAVAPMPQAVKSVQSIHSGISKCVFHSIRLGNYGVSAVVKMAFTAMDSGDRSTVEDEVTSIGSA